MDFNQRLQDLKGRRQKPPEFSHLGERLPPIPQVTAALAQVSPGPLASPSAHLREESPGGLGSAPRGAVLGLWLELVKPPQIGEASPSAHFLRSGPGAGQNLGEHDQGGKGAGVRKRPRVSRPQPCTATHDSCRRRRGETGDARPEKTKAKRPPPGARWPEAGLGPPGIPPRPSSRGPRLNRRLPAQVAAPTPPAQVAAAAGSGTVRGHATPVRSG